MLDYFCENTPYHHIFQFHNLCLCVEIPLTNHFVKPHQDWIAAQVIAVVDAVALFQIAMERPVVHLLGGATSQMHDTCVGHEI